ncbi:MAG: hypothetical protein AAF443_02185 [Chlamydiota bacterium]
MKFSTFASFDSHLREAIPEHPSSLYAVLVADSAERRYVVENLVHYYPAGEKEYHSAVQFPVSELWQAVHSLSLFSKQRFLVYDHIDQLKSAELDALAACVREKIPSDLVLILTGAAFSRSAAFYQKIKQELVLFDLSAEKPWERKERFTRWLIHLARKEEKVLSPSVAKKWLENSEHDFASLCSELAKWIAFVGKKKELELATLKQIESQPCALIGWRLSEALLWGQPIDRKVFDTFRLEDWHGLFGQLRYHLRTSLCIATAVRKGEQERLKEVLPRLYPQQVAKYRQLGALLGEKCLLSGLQKLAECEYQARMGIEPQNLFARWILQLRQGKNIGS